jgi:serralysin
VANIAWTGATSGNWATGSNWNGGGANDRLFGETGNDLIDDNGGNDFICGGTGKDRLTGGLGADDFNFKSIFGTGRGLARDFITDFRHLQDDIDANVRTAGNQAFRFIDDDDFSKNAGELRFMRQGGDTIVAGDVNGDGRADFQIELDRFVNLARADFAL